MESTRVIYGKSLDSIHAIHVQYISNTKGTMWNSMHILFFMLESTSKYYLPLYNTCLY
jgi:hypothetical protein